MSDVAFGPLLERIERIISAYIYHIYHEHVYRAYLNVAEHSAKCCNLSIVVAHHEIRRDVVL